MKDIIKDITNAKSDNFFLIGGPCAVESEDMTMQIAETVSKICENLSIPYIFKASYKKANRSKLNSFTGIGDEKAIEILAKVKTTFNIPVTTDVHSVTEIDLIKDVVDIIQIPAFLCRQTELLVASANTGKIVNIKKGQFLSPLAMQFAVDKVRQSGNNKVMLTERGTTFGYQDLLVDFRGIPQMQAYEVPVILDCTHSLQQPNQSGGVTGGQPKLIETIARAGIAVGADGLFIETHPAPQNAKSDGANMLPLNELEPLLKKLVKLKSVVNHF